jgi:diguanylate cyclase (GGDEF)-like protein
MEKSAAGTPAFLSRLGGLPAPLAIGAGLALALLIGVIEIFQSAPGYSLEFFYLIPILLMTWVLGTAWGVTFSALCASIYLAAGLYAGPLSFPNPGIVVWNSVFRFGVYLTVTLLAGWMRGSHSAENRLRRIDSLTGALNNRGFYEAVRAELDRARRYRHPFTVVYVDLDRFKEINEAFGRSIGDAVLRTVARTITGQVRVVDLLSRLGGDEFALLLPETGLLEAEGMLPRLGEAINAEMQRGQWPTSVSIGATVFRGYPRQVDDIIYMAEHAMQKAQRSAASAIHITVFEEEAGS